MKMQSKVLSVLTSLFLITACSSENTDFLFGGKQDPMQDQDKAIEQGGPKPPIPESPKPIQSDAIRIDTVEFFNFKAGAGDEFRIGARMLLPDYEFEVRIVNMQEFPGATFDAATGMFNWKPAENTVTGADLYKDLVLQVEAIAKKPNSPILMSTRSVSIRVSRYYYTPEIVMVETNSAQPLREGSVSFITVEIDDPNSTSDQATWPTLLINGPKTMGSLAAFTSVHKVVQMPSGHIQYSLEINLKGVEVTSSYDTLGLVFKAVSIFNKMGAEQLTTLQVFNKLTEPVTTWTKTVEAPVGSKLDYQFMILDQKAEGVVTKPAFKDLPVGADVQCTSISRSVQSCRLLWTIPEGTAAGLARFSSDVVVESPYWKDKETAQKTFHFWIDVQVPPSPISEGDLK